MNAAAVVDKVYEGLDRALLLASTTAERMVEDFLREVDKTIDYARDEMEQDLRWITAELVKDLQDDLLDVWDEVTAELGASLLSLDEEGELDLFELAHIHAEVENIDDLMRDAVTLLDEANERILQLTGEEITSVRSYANSVAWMVGDGLVENRVEQSMELASGLLAEASKLVEEGTFEVDEYGRAHRPTNESSFGYGYGYFADEDEDTYWFYDGYQDELELARVTNSSSSYELSIDEDGRVVEHVS